MLRMTGECGEAVKIEHLAITAQYPALSQNNAHEYEQSWYNW
ncbi:MAG TPA: hypothetical protein PKC39_06535 [Ferruginibacter sp.]|nr:hypothetical protein [Ferruginibacter sp.]HMP20595.1 hypothetical protein [Ferruginibacter sp.]